MEDDNSSEEVRNGYCHCGCGQLAPIAKETNRHHGCTKGEPKQFVNHHHKRVPLEARFWNKVNKQGPMPSAEAVRVHPDIKGTQCWEWTGSCSRGYGYIRINYTNKLVTHVACFLATGKWPTLQMLHKCDNTQCVRLSHIFEGTPQENTLDMFTKGRGNAKLTWSKVRQIRNMISAGTAQRRAAERFKISFANVSLIARGETWKEAA